MSLLDSLPATIAGALSGLFRDAELVRVGVRTSDGRGGFEQSTARHTCKALVVDYTSFQRATAGIPANERKIIVLAATCAVEPQPEDRIIVQEKTWAVIEVTSDPANATYEARCR